jgi:hypothetical protein
MLGLSIARVRQLQDEYVLHSRMDRRGWHMFDEDDVETLRRRRAQERGQDPNAGGRPDERRRKTCDDCGREAIWLTDPLTERDAEAGGCWACWPARRRARRRAGFGRPRRR